MGYVERRTLKWYEYSNTCYCSYCIRSPQINTIVPYIFNVDQIMYQINIATYNLIVTDCSPRFFSSFIPPPHRMLSQVSFFQFFLRGRIVLSTNLTTNSDDLPLSMIGITPSMIGSPMNDPQWFTTMVT